jgi:hypothetical protein
MYGESRLESYSKGEDGMETKQHNGKTSSPVLIYYRGKRIGLYCAKLIGRCTVVLAHGAISFPVGTVLTVKFRSSDEKETDRKQAVAVVHRNSTTGMLLDLQATI